MGWSTLFLFSISFVSFINLLFARALDSWVSCATWSLLSFSKFLSSYSSYKVEREAPPWDLHPPKKLFHLIIFLLLVVSFTVIRNFPPKLALFRTKDFYLYMAFILVTTRVYYMAITSRSSIAISLCGLQFHCDW